ncbi:UNVERIFIED_CONTAM: hypothetical protein NCL1_08317 [Trichonephila clavipes]
MRDIVIFVLHSFTSGMRELTLHKRKKFNILNFIMIKVMHWTTDHNELFKLKIILFVLGCLW